jgi:hypothetical protein
MRTSACEMRFKETSISGFHRHQGGNRNYDNRNVNRNKTYIMENIYMPVKSFFNSCISNQNYSDSIS